MRTSVTYAVCEKAPKAGLCRQLPGSGSVQTLTGGGSSAVNSFSRSRRLRAPQVSHGAMSTQHHQASHPIPSQSVRSLIESSSGLAAPLRHLFAFYKPFPFGTFSPQGALRDGAHGRAAHLARRKGVVGDDFIGGPIGDKAKKGVNSIAGISRL